ncbi:hypothetical protein B0I35DRAFT_6317 [Stachybotrys elegans]|uniref:Diaminohydroxyphosphoribosylamino-pyrimidine deaminase n=1 Tax=Stachybotrys elegans TaxID=80388 RepID=A0A8K0T5Z9_9HYPO|nr:hypothetical protein B0I35DRAFT_6317 [Stachybotrys elegans]
MTSPHESFTSLLDPEVEDADEETFLLYSQPIPSQNLGFVDPTAHSIDVSLAGRDLTIYQSPTILSSNRAGGTTGAVLWKVTPLFSEWLSSPTNILFSSNTLNRSSAVLELGCGISPLNALALAPRLGRYVLTDQPYVQKLIQQNLAENPPPRRASYAPVLFKTLDWETDEVTSSLTGDAAIRSFDAVLACDCVFNYALVQPFVQACVDVCRLRTRDDGKPCVCIVAQQLRNDEVFQSWLETFLSFYHVWRMPDKNLPEDLRSTKGFVVHIGILRESNPDK